MDEHYTKNQEGVRKCVGELTGVQGLPAVLHLLNRYHATRICEVPEHQYADFIDHCESLISNKGD